MNLLKNLNDTNGSAELILNCAENCLTEFDESLFGCEMGIAYGGGIESIGKIWKNRGTIYGVDTFEGHPKYLAETCSYSKKIGGINSFAAKCMDYWYYVRKDDYGIEKIKQEYIQSQLDKQKLDNVILIKELITNQTKIDFIQKLHYVLIDLDIPTSIWDAYNLVKDKIVSKGYLCLHDCLPENHIFGCYDIYQNILKENLFNIIKEYPKNFLVILRKK